MIERCARSDTWTVAWISRRQAGGNKVGVRAIYFLPPSCEFTPRSYCLRVCEAGTKLLLEPARALQARLAGAMDAARFKQLT